MTVFPIDLSRNCIVSFLFHVHLLILLATHQIFLESLPPTHYLLSQAQWALTCPGVWVLRVQ